MNQLKAEQKNNYLDLLPIEPFPTEKFDVFLDDVANDENFERPKKKRQKPFKSTVWFLAQNKKTSALKTHTSYWERALLRPAICAGNRSLYQGP